VHLAQWRKRVRMEEGQTEKTGSYILTATTLLMEESLKLNHYRLDRPSMLATSKVLPRRPGALNSQTHGSDREICSFFDGGHWANLRIALTVMPCNVYKPASDLSMS
jgi:hypothetical protein